MLSQHVQTIADHQDESGRASDLDFSSVWVTVSADRPSPACLPCCHSFSACPCSTTACSVCFRWDSATHSQGFAGRLQAVWVCLSPNAKLGASYKNNVALPRQDVCSVLVYILFQSFKDSVETDIQMDVDSQIEVSSQMKADCGRLCNFSYPIGFQITLQWNAADWPLALFPSPCPVHCL